MTQQQTVTDLDQGKTCKQREVGDKIDTQNKINACCTQDVRGEGGHLFSDRMKTPSGKRQARLKGMAASGRRGVTELGRRPMWREDGGFGGAARSLAAADGAGREGWEFFFVGWMALK